MKFVVLYSGMFWLYGKVNLIFRMIWQESCVIDTCSPWSIRASVLYGVSERDVGKEIPAWNFL